MAGLSDCWGWQLYATQKGRQQKDDRGDSQLTESVRPPDADSQACV